MKKTFICISILFVGFSFFAGCGKEASREYIFSGIEKINSSNSIHVQFSSESVTGSDHVTQGTKELKAFFIKAPFTWYSESVNSYYEDGEEKFSLTYGSYIETVNQELIQYEKYLNSPNEMLQWKVTGKGAKGIKDQADYYKNEIDAYLFMFASNIDHFDRSSLDKLEDKDVFQVDGFFTNETASECIDKYLKQSFLAFNSDFANTHWLTLIKNSTSNTPVSIWFDQKSRDPIRIRINLTEAEKSYRDTLNAASSRAAKMPTKVSESSITIDIEYISNESTFPAPEGIPATN